VHWIVINLINNQVDTTQFPHFNIPKAMAMWHINSSITLQTAQCLPEQWFNSTFIGNLVDSQQDVLDFDEVNMKPLPSQWTRTEGKWENGPPGRIEMHKF